MVENTLTGGGYSVFHETMADMTFPELVEAARQGAAVLWGLGVIEEHGPHLPLATDVYVPYAALRRVRRLLAEQGIPSVVMPPFYWGVNHVTGRFPGSFEVRPEIVTELMIDILKSLKKDGFSNLFCLSGHGDALHNRTILEAVKRGSKAAPINGYMVVTPSFVERLGFDPADPHLAVTEPSGEAKGKYADVHAGDWETSLIWGLYPELVRTEIVPTLKPTNFSPADLEEWRKGQEHTLRKTPHGYLGDPAASKPERGVDLMERQARLIAAAIAAKLRAQTSGSRP